MHRFITATLLFPFFLFLPLSVCVYCIHVMILLHSLVIFSHNVFIRVLISPTSSVLICSICTLYICVSDLKAGATQLVKVGVIM